MLEFELDYEFLGCEIDESPIELGHKWVCELAWNDFKANNWVNRFIEKYRLVLDQWCVVGDFHFLGKLDVYESGWFDSIDFR
jgi:hypothetical protein